MRRVLTDEQRQAVAARYLTGCSSEDMAREYGVDAGTVLNVLRAAAIPRRPPSVANRRLALDESVFDVITPESAYWVGFLMADGSVGDRSAYRESASINLTLSEKDWGHVEKFKLFLGAGHAVQRMHYPPSRPAYRITVQSSRLAVALARYGVVPRKSLTAEVRGGLDSNRDFWRGVVDGDGYIDAHMVQLCGARRLCEQFAAFARRIVPTRAAVLPHKNIWRVSVGGSFTLPLVCALYSDCTVALDRKLAVARSIISQGEARRAA